MTGSPPHEGQGGTSPDWSAGVFDGAHAGGGARPPVHDRCSTLFVG